VLRSVCRLAKIPVVSAGIPNGWVDNVRHLCSIVLVGDNTNKGGKWADSIYTRNPDEAEKTVIRMENAKITKDKASDIQNTKRGKKSRKRLK
jgi:hypothetical protein